MQKRDVVYGQEIIGGVGYISTYRQEILAVEVKSR